MDVIYNCEPLYWMFFAFILIGFGYFELLCIGSPFFSALAYIHFGCFGLSLNCLFHWYIHTYMYIHTLTASLDFGRQGTGVHSHGPFSFSNFTCQIFLFFSFLPSNCSLHLNLKLVRTATAFNFCHAGFCAFLITFSFL